MILTLRTKEVHVNKNKSKWRLWRGAGQLKIYRPSEVHLGAWNENIHVLSLVTLMFRQPDGNSSLWCLKLIDLLLSVSIHLLSVKFLLVFLEVTFRISLTNVDVLYVCSTSSWPCAVWDPTGNEILRFQTAKKRRTGSCSRTSDCDHLSGLSDQFSKIPKVSKSNHYIVSANPL